MKPEPPAQPRIGGQWGRGVLLKAIYGLTQILQTVGLKTTDAAVSGFITGMYVVLTPLLLFLIARTPMSRTALTASVMALVGLGVLSLRGFAFSGGAAITFGGSLVYAATKNIRTYVFSTYFRKYLPRFGIVVRST